jgi:hypothetical protein
VKIEFAVSERLKAEFLNLTGKDIQAVFITDSGARHIKKQHGQGEALRGQVDVAPDDFAFIPLVLNEFDRAEHTGFCKNKLTCRGVCLVTPSGASETPSKNPPGRTRRPIYGVFCPGSHLFMFDVPAPRMGPL